MDKNPNANLFVEVVAKIDWRLPPESQAEIAMRAQVDQELKGIAHDLMPLFRLQIMQMLSGRVDSLAKAAVYAEAI